MNKPTIPTGFTITANATDGIFDITGTSGTNSVTYAVAPYSTQQTTKASFDTSSTNPTRTDRLNYNGYLYATKLYSNGTEVSVVSHTHPYAGSASAGGAATSAEKLTNTSAIGSATNPVYFTANGVPSACTYSLNKTVPANALFTDELVYQKLNTDNTGLVFPLLFSDGAYADPTDPTHQISFTEGTYSADISNSLYVMPYKGALFAHDFIENGTSLSYKYADINHNHAGVYQPIDADLTAIAALTSTGFLKRTGTNT